MDRRSKEGSKRGRNREKKTEQREVDIRLDQQSEWEEWTVPTQRGRSDANWNEAAKNEWKTNAW